MRRVFAILLVTPLLANCSDSATPLAPPGARLEIEESGPGEWPSVEQSLEGSPLQLVEESPLQGAPGAGEVMVFGNPDAGSSFSPPGSHDQSLHARDRIIPGTVVIDSGQTVTFQVNPGHRVGIYDDGMRPEDILPNPGPFVLYPVNRLFLQPTPVPQFTLKFTRPGKYLVICAISNHFFGANMWGWVIVR
jgi:plastocyanin